MEGQGVVGGSSGRESDPCTLYYTERGSVGRERGNVKEGRRGRGRGEKRREEQGRWEEGEGKGAREGAREGRRKEESDGGRK